MGKKLFVCGTGTDVGKTFVTGLMVKKLRESGRRAAYYKAAMSGNVRGPEGRLIPGDARYVREISGIGQPLEEMCPYVYEAAVSPHLAARMEGNPVCFGHALERLDAVCKDYDYITVEGSGGILCPLRFDERRILLEDLIRARSFRCVLVADAGLGTINSVVLTAEYMKAREIPLKGILFNRFRPGDPLHEDNRVMCEALTGSRVIACVKEGDRDLELPVEALAELYE